MMKKLLLLVFTLILMQCIPEEKLPVCTTAQDLAKYDGQRVYIVGKLSVSPEKWILDEIILKDTSVVPALFKVEYKELLDTYQVKLKGRIFYEKEIPRKYGIFQRVNLPYLVDIELMEKAD